MRTKKLVYFVILGFAFLYGGNAHAWMITTTQAQATIYSPTPGGSSLSPINYTVGFDVSQVPKQVVGISTNYNYTVNQVCVIPYYDRTSYNGSGGGIFFSMTANFTTQEIYFSPSWVCQPLPANGIGSVGYNFTLPLGAHTIGTLIVLGYGYTNTMGTLAIESTIAQDFTPVPITVVSTLPASCTTPWGTTLASGSSVTAYASASVTSPATCTSETRTCTNGTLSGSYTSQGCTVTAAAVNGVCAATHYSCSAGTSAYPNATGQYYYWSCLGSGGGTSPSCSEAIAQPPTISLYRSPATLYQGQTQSISWSTTNATSLSYSCQGYGSHSGQQALNGSANSTWDTLWNAGWHELYTCTWTATGPGGSVTIQETFYIVPPAPTVSVSRSPATLYQGQTQSVSWSTTNATSLPYYCTGFDSSWHANGSYFSGVLPLSGSSSSTWDALWNAGWHGLYQCIWDPGSTTYTTGYGTYIEYFNIVPAPVCTYSCPAGSTMSGSGATATCQAPPYQPAGVAATPYCPAGGTLLGTTCGYQPAQPVYIAATATVNDCPSAVSGDDQYLNNPYFGGEVFGTRRFPIAYSSGTVYRIMTSAYGMVCATASITKYAQQPGQMAYQLIRYFNWYRVSTTYSCSPGYVRSGNTCYLPVAPAPDPTPALYSCPPGYTRSGTTCYPPTIPLAPTAVLSSCAPPPPVVTCTTPWGSTIPDSISVTAFKDPSVTAPANCISQTRTCNSGNLTGTFTNQNCSVVAAPTCTLPWGGTIPSGSSVTAYQTSVVNDPATCSSVSQIRTCTNGTLSGSYTNQTCSVQAACALPWGGTTPSGSIVTAYQSPSVISPATCSSVYEARVCNNGTLSGSFTNQSCTVIIPTCTSPWGGTVSEGTIVTAYQSSSVTSPTTCASVAQTRTCHNGNFIPSAFTYTNPNCSATPAPCTTPWGAYIPSGSSVTAYRVIAVKSPAACSSVAETRACTNGTLSGSFVNQYCKVMPTYSSF